MPENVKKCAENAAKVLNSIAPDKRDVAAVIAESFAAGLATGIDLAEDKTEKADGE